MINVCLLPRCTYNHCHDPDCLRERLRSSDGKCHEPNCRKCRGLDPKESRQVGYVRRPELGRGKDRGIRSESLTYRPRVYDGSTAEAIAGWPSMKPEAKRNGILEPLGKVDGVNSERENKHARRHEVLARQKDDARDLWQMPKFTNGATPRISSFRDPGMQLVLLTFTVRNKSLSGTGCDMCVEM